MSAIRLPADHSLRRQLADEIHARPPAAVASPAVVSCVALTDAPAAESLACVRALAKMHGDEIMPAEGAAHVVLELPGLRVKWERHGEFVTLTFVRPMPGLTLDTIGVDFPSALDQLPPDWLAQLPGRTIAATDVLLLPFGATEPQPAQIARWFVPEALAGSNVLDEAAWMFTDFVVKDSGRTRFLLLDVRLGRAQSARVVQRLIEIEVYRMMALLAFPLTRSAFAELNEVEGQLSRITSDTAALHQETGTASAQAAERRLLDELTQLAAEVERSVASTAFRFSAALAYWDIVRARVTELREQRLGDMRTLNGFLSRRMAPAMDSCSAVSRRQDEVSARIARASGLLRTRVDVAREEQNQRLLAAMDRRGTLQLRLQQTVEGLSVAAITYYSVMLVSYLAKPLAHWWPWLQPDWVTAAAIPVIGYAVWRAVRRVRQGLERD